MYEVFAADCKREMYLKKMKNKDLAELTGYKCSTIDVFFSDLNTRQKSERVAKAISKALNVEL